MLNNDGVILIVKASVSTRTFKNLPDSEQIATVTILRLSIDATLASFLPLIGQLCLTLV
jgi:hypothetical protein